MYKLWSMWLIKLFISTLLVSIFLNIYKYLSTTTGTLVIIALLSVLLRYTAANKRSPYMNRERDELLTKLLEYFILGFIVIIISSFLPDVVTVLLAVGSLHYMLIQQ